ncbi:MAG: DNA polymerase III subunit delta [Candidatus Wildermuthbacteria bacterium]|nr:DNA polymerase III subunit delta [Candidatus Wildermuthbacteria bacterium]
MALFTLYGQDTYRSHQKLQEFRGRFLKRFGSAGRELVWEAPLFSMEEARAEIEGGSLFGGTKFLVLKNLFGHARILDDLLSHRDLLTARPDSVVWLFFQEGACETIHPLWEILRAHGTAQEFQPLKGAQLLSWIAKEFSAYGKTIRREAAGILARHGGSDLWFLAHEIQKISLAVPQTQRDIPTEDVLPFSGDSREYNVFVMLNAVLSGRTSEAFGALDALLRQGEHALRICSALGFQVRSLLMVKAMVERGVPKERMASVGGLQPFAVRNMLVLHQRFSLGRLVALHRRVARLDRDLKTGREDPQSALFTLLSRL